MGTSLAGPDPWSDITRVCSSAGPRRAAVAYLGSDAFSLMPLKSDDILVVNAGSEALLAHATSPDALERYVDAGVQVYSSDKLHAKVVATKRHAVIGSSNASKNSTSLLEACVITDVPSLVRAVHRFVDALPDLTCVDSEFLSAARETWEKGRDARLPGTGDGLAPDSGFLPVPVTRLFLGWSESYYPTTSELRVFDAERRRHRRTAGPAAVYGVTSWRLEHGDRPHLPDDVLVLLAREDDGTDRLYPPQVVLSKPQLIPRGRGASIHMTKYRLDLDPIDRREAESQLRDVGIRQPRLDRGSYVRSPTTRAAILQLWTLGV